MSPLHSALNVNLVAVYIEEETYFRSPITRLDSCTLADQQSPRPSSLGFPVWSKFCPGGNIRSSHAKWTTNLYKSLYPTNTSLSSSQSRMPTNSIQSTQPKRGPTRDDQERFTPHSTWTEKKTHYGSHESLRVVKEKGEDVRFLQISGKPLYPPSLDCACLVELKGCFFGGKQSLLG